MAKSLISTQGLAVGYKRGNEAVQLLAGLNLDLCEGTLVALLGMNGAGKSTLLRAITGDTRPLAGKLCYAGRDVTEMSLSERARFMGLVSTDRIAAGGLTVTELVEMGRQPHTGFLGRLSKHDHEVVAHAIESVGMAHKANSYTSSLSDGERQKCMIARALAQETPVIVLDEPTAFLDVASRIETMELLSNLAHKQGKAVLLSSHDMSQSLLKADELWLITHDREVLTGTARELVEQGAMERLFPSPNIRFNPTILDYEHV
ncbi:ABC transporter ATP-binding protein [Sodaliphilus sp.]|uniref:ABC transporter ATP-binding protein n=1 Tax=Sodaliphilus sp. TaxID=2815818 RepID=UPI00388F1C6A